MDFGKFKKDITKNIQLYKEKKEEIKARYLEILNKELDELVDVINQTTDKDKKENLLNAYNKLVNLKSKLENI